MECSQPLDEVTANSGLITCPPDTVTRSIKHPIVLDLKPVQSMFGPGLSILGPPLARFLDFKMSSYWKMITQGRGSASSIPSSKYWETSSKLPKVALLPSYTDVILRPGFSQIAATAISLDLGLSSLKIVLPPSYTAVSLRSKTLFSISPSVLGLGLASLVMPCKRSKTIPTCTEIVLWPQYTFAAPSTIGIELVSIPNPQIILRPICVDLVLQPKNVSPTSPTVLSGLGSICLMPHPKITFLSTWTSYLLRPKFISPPHLELGSISSMTQSKPAKNILPTTCFSAVFPTRAFPLPSPSIDLKISDSESNKKNNSRVHALQAKVATQVKIHGESKARANKAAKALRNVWTRNSKYRRWVKVRKQAEKALQIADDKLAAIPKEEEKVWSEIESMKKTL